MAAGLTDHVWTLREVLLFRVPPWPQPQALLEAREHEDRGKVSGPGVPTGRANGLHEALGTRCERSCPASERHADGTR